jgi:[ribosomal protein S5]-alanine N-acetyltransferase
VYIAVVPSVAILHEVTSQMGWPGSRIRSTSRSRTDCTPATTPIRSSSWTTAGSLRSAGTSASSVLLDQDGAYARLFEPAPNRRENGTSGTMARMVLPTPLLHTDRLRLRPFDDADADALYAMQSSPHVLRYWDAPPWTERGRAQKFIAKCRKMAEDGIGARLAVDRLEDGAFIGWCSLTRWNPDYRSAALGYCFTDAAWGHGYATEAARALLQWAYDTLDLNRIQAETDTRNAASARVLEKVGFVREGTLRQDCIVNGDVSDSWVYGLIGSDWRSSSEPAGAIQSTLDACNTGFTRRA